MGQTKFFVGLVLAVLLAVGVSVSVNHYVDLRKASAQNEIRQGVLTATTAGVEVGVNNQREQDDIDSAIAKGARDFTITLQEAKRNDPTTADRAVRPVPDSVRNAYRQRRLARERSGCAGSECEARRSPGDAE